MKSLIATSAVLYGKVTVGPGSIIEDDVVIGHPSALEIASERASMANFESLRAFYSHVSRTPTVIGARAIIRSGTVIYSGVTIGDDFDCGHHVLIREGAEFGHRVYLKALTHIMRDVTLGSDVRISAIIADGSRVGDRSSVFGTLTHRRPKRQPKDSGPWVGPHVGRDCLVGRGAVLLGPLVLGDGATVAAGAVVVEDVEAGVMVHGPLASPHRQS